MGPLKHAVLSVNCGSSSLKYAVFSFAGDGDSLLRRGAAGPGALPEVLEAIDSGPIGAVGHRLVHGGFERFDPEIATPQAIASLKACIPLAPLHLPAQIAAIEFIQAHRPDLPQVICYDTAFHRASPEIARRLPLPRRLWDLGVRKYGFHGLSFDFVVRELGPDAMRGAVVIAHLGNGASLCALRDGRPIDTTMGLTPNGGLMMGTRSGDLDPGVLLHLLRSGSDSAALSRLIESESGLLGVSGTTSDMQKLEELAESDPHAAQAIDMFCYHARKHVGALAAALGGLDLLVFTGGIGENSALVRERICAGIGFLDCAVRVVPTDEDRMVARYTREIVFR